MAMAGDGWEFGLSVFENDSTDGSNYWFHDNSDFWDHHSELVVATETLRTNYHGSVVNSERVHNLAAARNRCLDAVADLSIYDRVVFVEPDVTYDPAQMLELLSTDHDICSGYTSHPDGRFYDTWATRRQPADEWWDGSIPEAPTPVASTFNGVCVYRADPFAEGIRFSGHSPARGSFDCDTAVICELFRDAGHDDIVMYPFRVVHYG
jgi:glycosyltransferase involved in cell wall biosynthesis